MTTTSTVTVNRREFSSTFTSTSPTVRALIRRTVPPTGREWQPETRSWLVYGTRVARLLAALHEAGVEIVDSASGTTS